MLTKRLTRPTATILRRQALSASDSGLPLPPGFDNYYSFSISVLLHPTRAPVTCFALATPPRFLSHRTQRFFPRPLQWQARPIDGQIKQSSGVNAPATVIPSLRTGTISRKSMAFLWRTPKTSQFFFRLESFLGWKTAKRHCRPYSRDGMRDVPAQWRCFSQSRHREHSRFRVFCRGLTGVIEEVLSRIAVFLKFAPP